MLDQAQLFGFELAETEAAEPPPDKPPFRVLAGGIARPFENCLPLYSLKAAAGAFSGTQVVEPEAWIEPNSKTRPAAGLFVAQVVGESMNRRIPNGAFCIFRHPVEGSRRAFGCLRHCAV